LHRARAFWYPDAQMNSAGRRDHVLLGVIVVPVRVIQPIAP
jgi:hypothetical protein